MNCRHCLRAEQTAVWRSFTPGCNPCELRRIAYMTGEERERYLDRVQHLSGYSARQRVREDVDIERARIEVLKGRG